MTAPVRKKNIPLTLRPLGAYEAKLARVCKDSGWEPTQFIHFCISQMIDLIDADALEVPRVVRQAKAARLEMAKLAPTFDDEPSKKNSPLSQGSYNISTHLELSKAAEEPPSIHPKTPPNREAI